MIKVSYVNKTHGQKFLHEHSIKLERCRKYIIKLRQVF